MISLLSYNCNCKIELHLKKKKKEILPLFFQASQNHCVKRDFEMSFAIADHIFWNKTQNSPTKDFFLICQCIYNKLISVQRLHKCIHKIDCLSLTHLLSVPRQPHLASRPQQDLGAVTSNFFAFSLLLFLTESVSSSAYKHLIPQIFQNQHIQNWVIFSSKPASPPLILFPWKILPHSLSKPETWESPHREGVSLSLSLFHTQSLNLVHSFWKESKSLVCISFSSSSPFLP